MTEGLEDRLGARMAVWADHLADGPRFSADEIVQAARTVAGRRRVAGLVGLMAAVLALVLAAALLNLNGRAAPSPPSSTPTPSTSASTPVSTPSPTPGVPVAALGLDVLTDGVITRPDGSRVTLPVTPGLTPVDAMRVSGGWIVSFQGNQGSQLWLVPAAGAAHPIGDAFGSFAASADGTILVLGSASTLRAYELPSLRALGTANIDIGMGPVVVGIAGNRVLVRGGYGNPGPTEGAVWSLRTGGVSRTTRSLWLLGVSAGGAVLRLVPQTRAAKEVVGGCLDVVALTDPLPVAETGVCRPDLGSSYVAGSISPDGSWIVLTTADTRTMLLRSGDVHSGRWQPRRLDGPPDARPLFWVTGTTFVATGGGTGSGGPAQRYYRCDVTQACTELAFPAGMRQPVLVRTAGA